MNLELMKEYKKTGNIKIRNQIVEENIPLVRFVVSRMCAKNYYEHEFEDLVSYGIFGLFTAIDKFDLTLGLKFSTYAHQKIYFSVIDELRKIDWVPRAVRYKIRRVTEEVKQAENTYGYEIDASEIAKHYGLSIKDMEVMNGTCVSSVEPLLEYLYDARETKYDYVLR